MRQKEDELKETNSYVPNKWVEWLDWGGRKRSGWSEQRHLKPNLTIDSISSDWPKRQTEVQRHG